MTVPVCSRQKEVSALLTQGHWPHACPADLRVHLAGCGACSELLMVSEAFQLGRRSAIGEARLPAAGAIWWRAQLRRRNADLERVAKPIFGAYIFALLFTLAAAAIIAVSQAKHGLRWLDWWAQSGSAALHVDPLTPSWFTTGGSLAILIPVLAMAALVGAVVVYFAAERP
jgi:hypothetical protein